MSQKQAQNTGKLSENAIIARLMPDIIKGKASYWPIRKELNDNPYISEERFYVNGVQTILMKLGIVGLLLYVLFYGSVFRKGDILARMSIITLLVFSLLESDYLNPYHLLLTVIPCAIVYRQSVIPARE